MRPGRRPARTRTKNDGHLASDRTSDPARRAGDTAGRQRLHADGHPSCYVEAKSSTDATNRVGLFPRVPTKRGQRHIQELIHALDEGYRAAIVFIVQRTDADRMQPNDSVDPDFGAILRKAVKHGVEAFAWTTRFIEATHEIVIDESIPVDLSSLPDEN